MRRRPMQSVRQNSARVPYQMINVLEKRAGVFPAQNARPGCISRNTSVPPPPDPDTDAARLSLPLPDNLDPGSPSRFEHEVTVLCHQRLEHGPSLAWLLPPDLELILSPSAGGRNDAQSVAG